MLESLHPVHCTDGQSRGEHKDATRRELPVVTGPLGRAVGILCNGMFADQPCEHTPKHKTGNPAQMPKATIEITLLGIPSVIMGLMSLVVFLLRLHP